MNKLKVDFISDLLSHKDISVVEKERLFGLTKDEIQKMGEEGDDRLREVIERIERLEREQIAQINIAPSSTITETPMKITKTPELANPKDVANFMSLFNQRDGLKYLTHDYDEESDFEIDEFLISREKVFSEVTSRKFNIPPSLWRIVKQFAFDSKQTKWTTISEDYKNFIGIEIGWASPELRDWSKQTKLHPIRNEKYKQVINDFRRITRIESPNLETLIENTIDKVFSDRKNDFEIETNDLSKADFYTHVGFLKTALETVFEEIKKRTDEECKKKVRIEYQRETEDDYFIRKILITHYNSFPTKELGVLLEEWNSFDKGCMGKIGKNMQGYCHWSVVTQIEGSPIKVNILKEKDTPGHEPADPSEAVGFTHIFTFYYK